MRNVAVLPRFIRARDAHGYCGMSREIFNDQIRPYLVEIPIGTQGIAFDRLEMDDVLDDYKSRNGRPAINGGRTWEVKEHQASLKERGSGTSTKLSKDMDDFVNLVKQEKLKRRNVV